VRNTELEVDVFRSFTNVKKERIIGGDVLVIDIYRTTSVIITALARKADQLCIWYGIVNIGNFNRNSYLAAMGRPFSAYIRN